MQLLIDMQHPFHLSVKIIQHVIKKAIIERKKIIVYTDIKNNYQENPIENWAHIIHIQYKYYQALKRLF